MHLDILKREESVDLLKAFDVVLLDMWADTPITTPDGKAMKASDWAKQLNVFYAPSFVFFDNGGKEVFRTGGYLRAFHTQSVMDYVASGAYQKEPELQRYIDARADHLREQGVEVDLMQ